MSKPVSTSWCFGAQVGALEHELVLWGTSWCFGARAGALEHKLVLCEIMSNLKPSEKDTQNIVSDMAAQVDLSKSIQSFNNDLPFLG